MTRRRKKAPPRKVIDGTTEECFLCGKDHRVDPVCPPMQKKHPCGLPLDQVHTKDCSFCAGGA